MESYPKYSIRASPKQKTPFDSHRVLKTGSHKPKLVIITGLGLVMVRVGMVSYHDGNPRYGLILPRKVGG